MPQVSSDSQPAAGRFVIKPALNGRIDVLAVLCNQKTSYSRSERPEHTVEHIVIHVEHVEQVRMFNHCSDGSSVRISKAISSQPDHGCEKAVGK